MQNIVVTYKLHYIVMVFTMAMFFSCNANFKKVQKIGVSENEPIGVAEHINLKYTDSGKVQAILKSPIMFDYSNRKFAYNEFTEGINLELFDKHGNKNTVIADYAVSYSKTNIIDLQGNVVVATHNKDTLFAQQLFYDTVKEWLYTNQPVTYISKDNLINGNGFDSDKEFSNAEVLEVTGDIIVRE
ncbi:LPS export ABC transporter periplasmic protein LptC [Flavobacteriaceae bacterium MHTCC 0001]